MHRSSHCSSDRGQAVMLLLIAVALAAVALVAAGRLAGRVVARGHAQTAADAAALAGAMNGRNAAIRLASTNGGHMLSIVFRDGTVTVIVEVDGERAVASATVGP